MRAQARSLSFNFNFRSLDRFYFYLIFLVCPILAAPVARDVPATAALLNARQLVNPTNGNVFDPSGQNTISQSSASDGGGTGFSLPSVLWIGFAAGIGAPLAVAGVRGWRITSGIGIGLSFSILMWCAFVNTMSTDMLSNDPIKSDLVLSAIVWISFIIGFGLGFVRVGTYAGMFLLSACGGVSFAILLVLLRPGLLVPIYGINLAFLAILAFAGGAWPMWHQRLSVIISSATCGSFLIALAIDLVINKQTGISRGLRFLLDRNTVHLGDIVRNGYKPKISTLVILGVAFALIPIFSYAQHRFFKEPFDRSPESLQDHSEKLNGAPIVGPGEEGYVAPKLPKTSYSGTGSGSTGLYTVPEDPPQHTHMRFPSIIPSLPGNVDPRFREREAPQQMLPQIPTQSVPIGGLIPSPAPVSTRNAFWNRVSANFRFGGQTGGTGQNRQPTRDQRQGSDSTASQYSTAPVGNRFANGFGFSSKRGANNDGQRDGGGNGGRRSIFHGRWGSRNFNPAANPNPPQMRQPQPVQMPSAYVNQAKQMSNITQGQQQRQQQQQQQQQQQRSNYPPPSTRRPPPSSTRSYAVNNTGGGKLQSGRRFDR